jgi:hypothetical protein
MSRPLLPSDRVARIYLAAQVALTIAAVVLIVLERGRGIAGPVVLFVAIIFGYASSQRQRNQRR